MSALARVLLVDDEPDIREIAVLSLELDPGLEVRALSTAGEALDLLSKAEWKPDIVLLDVMMADVDGVAALGRLRMLPGCAELPVVFVTARTRQADVAVFMAAGAAAVITKPFAPLRLAPQIRDILDARAGGASIPS